MNQAVNSRGSGHRVLEDGFPLGKRQVAGEQDACPLIAVGQEGKEDFHLFSVLLHIADVIYEDGGIGGKFFKCPCEFQVTFCDKEFLNEQGASGEIYLSALTN